VAGAADGEKMDITEVLKTVSLETDPFALVISTLSLIVSAYIAIVLHRLSRKFQQNEAIRSINLSWDSFHNAMLSGDAHDLFWKFMNSDQPVQALGQREHHIVLMYVNNIHTEYHAYKARLFSNYDVKYLDTLLRVLVPRRHAVIDLARLSGYDDEFLRFAQGRLDALAAKS
jgi:hypothetical protein